MIQRWFTDQHRFGIPISGQRFRLNNRHRQQACHHQFQMSHDWTTATTNCYKVSNIERTRMKIEITCWYINGHRTIELLWSRCPTFSPRFRWIFRSNFLISKTFAVVFVWFIASNRLNVLTNCQTESADFLALSLEEFIRCYRNICNAQLDKVASGYIESVIWTRIVRDGVIRASRVPRTSHIIYSMRVQKYELFDVNHQWQGTRHVLGYVHWLELTIWLIDSINGQSSPAQFAIPVIVQSSLLEFRFHVCLRRYTYIKQKHPLINMVDPLWHNWRVFFSLACLVFELVCHMSSGDDGIIEYMGSNNMSTIGVNVCVRVWRILILTKRQQWRIRHFHFISIWFRNSSYCSAAFVFYWCGLGDYMITQRNHSAKCNLSSFHPVRSMNALCLLHFGANQCHQ